MLLLWLDVGFLWKFRICALMKSTNEHNWCTSSLGRQYLWVLKNFLLLCDVVILVDQREPRFMWVCFLIILETEHLQPPLYCLHVTIWIILYIVHRYDDRQCPEFLFIGCFEENWLYWMISKTRSYCKISC